MFKRLFISLLLCASAQIFSATPNPTASDTERGEVILWIDGKPALYASDLEKKLYEFQKNKDYEDYEENVLKRLLYDKSIKAWIAKENIFTNPDFSKFWNEIVHSTKIGLAQEVLWKRGGYNRETFYEPIKKQLFKDFKVAVYPERIGSTNPNETVMTIDGKPALTLKQLNEQLALYREASQLFGRQFDKENVLIRIWKEREAKGLADTQEDPEFETKYKIFFLEELAFEKAVELWSKKNIEKESWYLEALNERLDMLKEQFIFQYLRRFFKISEGAVFDEIEKLKTALRVKENTEYWERFKKHINAVKEPFYKKRSLSYQEMIDFQQNWENAIHDFFHPQKVSEVK